MNRPLKPAVFLDRDGVINEETGYIDHLDRFVLLPGVGRAIRRLNEAGLSVAAASNQSGLARGCFPEELLEAVHDKMRRELAAAGAHLDGIYICPHHPEARVARYRADCDCRKPKPGLLLRAARDLHLDLARSWMVGDRWTDLRCGAAVGARTILVRSGYGRDEERCIGPNESLQPDHIADDLAAAVAWILKEFREESGQKTNQPDPSINTGNKKEERP